MVQKTKVRFDGGAFKTTIPVEILRKKGITPEFVRENDCYLEWDSEDFLVEEEIEEGEDEENNNLVDNIDNNN